LFLRRLKESVVGMGVCEKKSPQLAPTCAVAAAVRVKREEAEKRPPRRRRWRRSGGGMVLMFGGAWL
jgi:hypothetical protein